MSPPAKRRKFDFTEFKVVVGLLEDQETFTVAKEFLTKSSEFFRKACNGKWKENQIKTIKLPEATPDIFSAYLQWLYTSELVISDKIAPAEADEEASTSFHDKQWTRAINVYIFADSIMDARFQNSTMDFLQALLSNSPFFFTPKAAGLAVKGSMAGCPLRRFMADALCFYSPSHYFAERASEIPIEVVAETLAAFATVGETGKAIIDPCKTTKCHYHIHSKENPKCK